MGARAEGEPGLEAHDGTIRWRAPSPARSRAGRFRSARRPRRAAASQSRSAIVRMRTLVTAGASGSIARNASESTDARTAPGSVRAARAASPRAPARIAARHRRPPASPIPSRPPPGSRITASRPIRSHSSASSNQTCRSGVPSFRCRFPACARGSRCRCRLRGRRRRGKLPVQCDVGIDAVDDDLLQRGADPRDGELAGLAVRDELADHRIVVRRDLVAAVDVAVEPGSRARRAGGTARSSGRGAKRLRMLGVDATLDRVAVDAHVLLHERQRLARRDAELGLDDVDAGHELRHRCSTCSRVFISMK